MPDLSHLQQLILNLTRRLHLLEERQALYGLETPAHILIEIEDTRAEIAAHQAHLTQAEPAPPAAVAPASSSPRLFICYKRTPTDSQLAAFLERFFRQRGYDTFFDLNLQPGQSWPEEIDRRIQASDCFIILLSEESVTSEMVQAEVRRAYEYAKRSGRPRLLPVRLAVTTQPLNSGL